MLVMRCEMERLPILFREERAGSPGREDRIGFTQTQVVRVRGRHRSKACMQALIGKYNNRMAHE